MCYCTVCNDCVLIVSDLCTVHTHREILMPPRFQIPRLVSAPWRISDLTTKAYISPRTPPPLLLKSHIHHIAISTRPKVNRHLTSSRVQQSQSSTIPSFIQSLIRSFSGSADMPASDAAKTKVQKIIDENPVGMYISLSPSQDVKLTLLPLF